MRDGPPALGGARRGVAPDEVVDARDVEPRAGGDGAATQQRHDPLELREELRVEPAAAQARFERAGHHQGERVRGP